MKNPSPDNIEYIFINIDEYDNAFSEWVLQIFGKAIDDYSVMHRFDKQLGLQLCDDQEEVNVYKFVITDRRKFMLAKLKYGF